MLDIGLKNIKKSFGAHIVLTDVSFDIIENDRIGLIGRNGTGKTTIFNLIMGNEDYDEGLLSIRKNVKVSCLDQSIIFPDYFTVNDVLENAFEEIVEIKSELSELEKDMEILTDEALEKTILKYGELQNVFESKDGYNIDTKKEIICSGLKISDDMLNKDFKVLSGGEKTIISLAKILLENPDVLLLDEPSNHLDFKSIEWLEEYLSNYRGSVIISSHDRYFLDKVVTKIVELEDGKANVYQGNYSYYKKEKQVRLLTDYEAYKTQQRKIKAMEEAAKRYRVWARGDHDKFLKKAKELENKLEKMVRLKEPIFERRKMNLKLNSSSRSGNDTIVIENLCKSFDYGEKTILNEANLFIKYKEKVSIIGENGSGKSTILKLILSQQKPDSGLIKVGANVKIGYLDQNISFDDEELTVLDTFKDFFKVYEGEARNSLAQFLFVKDDVFKHIKNLSGGERTRLRLCLLMHSDINLLILDEPTNHLDIDSKEMLEEALSLFIGTIIFVSHDRYFINEMADRVEYLSDNILTSFDGNYDYFINQLQRKEDLILAEEKNIIKKSENSSKEKKKIIKVSKEKTRDFENEIKSLENKLSDLNKKLAGMGADYDEIEKVYAEKTVLQTEVDSLYELWVG